MNRYDCELVRDGSKWRFKRLTIDNAWLQGDAEILNVRATHRVLSGKVKEILNRSHRGDGRQTQ